MKLGLPRAVWIWRGTLAFVVVLCCKTVVDSLVSESSMTARASDIEKAKRIESSPASGDFRVATDENADVAGNGVVEPEGRETRIASQTSGIVKTVLVKEGQTVRQGDVVVELESDVEAAAVAVAEGELKVAKARLALAQRTLDRTKTLGAAATGEELDRATRQVAIETFTVDAASARVLQAQAALGRTRVRAPAVGEVLQVQVVPGEFYSPSASDPLLVVGDMRTKRVRVDVDERDVGRVREGRRAYVTADAFPGKRFPGRVVEIGKRMGRKNIRTDDPRERIDTKILEVVLALDPAPELLAGQRVVAYISSSTDAGADLNAEDR